MKTLNELVKTWDDKTLTQAITDDKNSVNGLHREMANFGWMVANGTELSEDESKEVESLSKRLKKAEAKLDALYVERARRALAVGVFSR